MHAIHGERFYGLRDEAWHKIGFISQVEMSAVEALSTGLKGAYTYELRPHTMVLDGIAQEVGTYAIVRSPIPDEPKEHPLGTVTKRYEIIQPLEIAEMFDQNVAQPVETMGLLLRGAKMFLTWKLNQFELFNGDKVDCYGLIEVGYDGLKGTNLYVVYVRVVCHNTLVLATNESQEKENGMGKLFAGRHISPNMRRDLAEWMKYVQGRALTNMTFQQEQMNRLAEEKVTQAEATMLLEKIFPHPASVNPNQPEVIRKEKEAARQAEVDQMNGYRSLAMELFNGKGTQIDQTLWGLTNSVTELVDWGIMTKKPAEHSMILGDRAKLKASAWNIITSYKIPDRWKV